MRIISPQKNSDGLYGLSKFCGEAIIEHILTPAGVKICNLRLGHVFMEQEFNSLQNSLMKQIKLGEVTIYGDGSRIIPITTGNKIGTTLLDVLERKLAGTYNLVDAHLTINQIVLDLEKQLDAKRLKRRYISNVHVNEDLRLVIASSYRAAESALS